MYRKVGTYIEFLPLDCVSTYNESVLSFMRAMNSIK